MASTPKVQSVWCPNQKLSPAVGLGITDDQESPSASNGSATIAPAMGPAAPMSTSASPVLICERMRMTAPSVPKDTIPRPGTNGGTGMT